MISNPDMWSEILAFSAGVLLAPAIRPLLRPLAVEVVKGVLLTVDEARRLSEQVKEDVEDVTAEARIEYEKRRAAEAAAAPPPPPPPPAAPPQDRSGN
jgi:hypothetical protein